MGETICLKLLTCKANVVHRTSGFHIPPKELCTQVFKDACATYTTELTTHTAQRDPEADDVFTVKNEEDIGPDTPKDEGGLTHVHDFYDSDAHMPDADDVDYDAYDKFISAKVFLPSEGEYKLGAIRKRQRDNKGIPLGQSDDNLIKYTSLCKVTFEDKSSYQVVTASIITENIYSQIDDEGHKRLVIKETMDHNTTDQVLQNTTRGTKTTE